MLKVESIFLEKNLLNFYDDFKGFSDYKFITKENYNCIYSKQFQWPGFIYNINFDNSSCERIYDEFYHKIFHDKLPPFLLVNPNRVPIDFEEKMFEYDIKKVDSWPLIYIDLTRFDNKLQTIKNFVITIVNNKKELKMWFNIVTSVLFNGKALSLDFFKQQIENNKYTFYLGYYNNVPITTALLINDEILSGFYMVATLPKYRKFGFGSEMVKKLIIDSKALGCNYITAQSSRMAFPLYKQIGFLDIDSIDVYWMVGKSKI